MRWKILGGVPLSRLLGDLRREIADDHVGNGAAALAFYLMLAAFPAAIFFLTLLPYLHIPHLDQAVMDLLRQALPGEAADLFTSTVQSVTSQRRGGLLSFGLLATLWSASNGMYAVMQQLNITYGVKEGRPFWKVRGLALLLLLLFVVLIVGALALVILGGVIQEWLAAKVGSSAPLLWLFAAFRWAVIGLSLLLGFALVYYVGPDVKQSFRFVSPGSALGVVLLAVASIAFRLYVSSFARFSATYGGLGAAIVLLLWLYVTGWVILLGSEINALVEHYAPAGKEKGEKAPGEAETGPRGPACPPRPSPA